VHYWADLQSVHGFRCYDNIAPNAKCQRLLVLSLCLCFVIKFCYSCDTVLVVEQQCTVLYVRRLLSVLFHTSNCLRGLFTDDFDGPGRAIGPVCVCLDNNF